MSGKIHIMLPSRQVSEGDIPKPLDRPEFSAGSREVLVSGGPVGEKTFRLPERITVGELLDVCGADPERIKAVYLGWPTGRFYAAEPDTELTLDCETAYLMENSECAVELLTRLSEEMRTGCCGRCVFGREGTYQLHLTFGDIATKKGRSTDMERMGELCRAMVAQSACGLGQAAGSSALSALDLFGDEVQAHIGRKVCPALVCKPYLSYYIDPVLCTGCQACADACGEDAIEGRKNFIHILDRDMCEMCGECVEVCPAGAIQIASGALPRLPVKPIPRGNWK